jgi:hypothetical protein
MQVTKDEFQQWKDSPVTEEVLELICDRIEDAKEILAASAGNDPLNDRFYVGMIRALREVLEISYEE